MDGGSLAKVGRVGKEEAWWYFTLFGGISLYLLVFHLTLHFMFTAIESGNLKAWKKA